MEASPNPVILHSSSSKGKCIVMGQKLTSFDHLVTLKIVPIKQSLKVSFKAKNKSVCID
jgi:hypothetical protein